MGRRTGNARRLRLEPLQTRDAATESDLADLIDRELAVIGERRRRVAGTGKVTSHAIYADDMLPGMLHAEILRSSPSPNRIAHFAIVAR